jgi:hypothetical protein
VADGIESLQNGYPGLKRFARTAREFWTYIANNAAAIPNHGERWRYGEPIARSFA